MMNQTLFKIALLHKGIPACGLAQALHIERATLSRICNGWIEPNSELKRRIAEFLNVREMDIWPPFQNLIEKASSKHELEKLHDELVRFAGEMKGPIRPEQREISELLDQVNKRLQEF